MNVVNGNDLKEPPYNGNINRNFVYIEIFQIVFVAPNDHKDIVIIKSVSKFVSLNTEKCCFVLCTSRRFLYSFQ